MIKRPVIGVVIALVVSLSAVVLSLVIPPGRNPERVASSLRGRIDVLEKQLAGGAPLKLAYVSVAGAFTFFADAVGDLRQQVADKQAEIAALEQQSSLGKVTQAEFLPRVNQLQAELLQAQINVDAKMLDMMIAGPGFRDMKADLQTLRAQAQPLVEEMRNLVLTARTGFASTDFQDRYNQVLNTFSLLDQLVTKAGQYKIVQAAEKVALREGFDLVLSEKDVIAYRNSERVEDITDLVKRELAPYI